MPTKPRARRARAAGPHGARRVARSLTSPILLALLAGVPIFFTPGLLIEEFEFPKSSLLATGVLVLLTWRLRGEIARAAQGAGRWARASSGRLLNALRGDPVGAAVAFFLLSALASTLASMRPPLSLYGAAQSRAGFITFAALGAVYYSSRDLARNPAFFRRLARAAGVAAALAALYALLQIAGLDPIAWHRSSAFEGTSRVGSTIGHANTLSAFLVLCLPLGVWLAATAGSRPARIGWLALTTASLLIIAMSLSRGAWIGVAAAGLVSFLLVSISAQRLRRPWVLALVALAIFAFVIPAVTPMRTALLDRFQQIADLGAATSRTRIELWRAGLRMLRDHPVFGVGLDAYVVAFPAYRTAGLTQIEWGGTPTKAHNDAIQVLATQGITGGLGALAIVILLVLAVWRLSRRGTTESRGQAAAAGAALVGYVVPSLVGFATASSSVMAAALAGWVSGAAGAIDAGHTGAGAREHEHEPAVARIDERSTPKPAWTLALALALAAAAWIVFVGIPWRAQSLLAAALRRPAGADEREALLSAAARTTPWDPLPSIELGRSLFLRGLKAPDRGLQWDYLAQARQAFDRAARLSPEDGESYVLLASAAAAQSAVRPEAMSKDEVRGMFHHAVALDPLNPTLLVAAERGLLGAGLEAEAWRIALRCARTYPDYAPPLADLGAIALQQGRTAAAAETLRLAVRREWRGDPVGPANAWNDLAQASLALGRLEEARDAADSALARNPGLAQAFAIRESAKRSISMRK